MSEAQQHRLALPQGTRIRDFEFHRVLGHGGFGMTYLGWNLALDIPVAIKEYLPGDLATREQDGSVVPQSSQGASDFQWGLERFLDEARTLARFQHPNIVRVLQYFEAHSTAYIVMEYAEGETLSAHIERKGSLQEAELKAILYPLLSALEVVHGADFLHRDIKPGNIVLRDVDGSPVLLDFGAARQAVGAKSRSVTSIVTPGYAPIEQYSSRGRQGAWTDIYALGGVCYRALTGQTPDDATDRVRDDPLVPASQRCAGRASGAFLSAVDWALSVDEGDRPQRVGAWRQAMGGAMGGAVAEKVVDEVPSAERVEQEAPLLERPKKTRFKWLVLGAVALLAWGVIYVALRWEQEEVARAALSDQGIAYTAAAFVEAAASGDLAVVWLFVEAGMSLESKGTVWGVTPLHGAAGYGRLKTVKYLLAQGASVGARNNYGETPLHVAAWHGHLSVAIYLVGQGASLTARDDLGNTPLHQAAANGQTAVANYLRSVGG